MTMKNQQGDLMIFSFTEVRNELEIAFVFTRFFNLHIPSAYREDINVKVL